MDDVNGFRCFFTVLGRPRSQFTFGLCFLFFDRRQLWMIAMLDFQLHSLDLQVIKLRSEAVTTSVWYQFFFRADGLWVLSDLTNQFSIQSLGLRQSLGRIKLSFPDVYNLLFEKGSVAINRSQPHLCFGIPQIIRSCVNTILKRL